MLAQAYQSRCYCSVATHPQNAIGGSSLNESPVPAETPGNKITAISPTTITAGVATAITLTGTVASGDLVTWAADCAAATPDVDPTDGDSQSTSFTVAAGVYKLCYRDSGLADSVEQTGITLNVAGAFTCCILRPPLSFSVRFLL